MSLRLRSALAVAVLAAAPPGLAQDAGRAAPRAPRGGVPSYSESVSRDLFAACDADSDDRLDVFEAADALDCIDSPRDSQGFQRLDLDRDGFVSWPEFDRYFWTVVQRGDPFHVRPCRQLVESAPERQEARPASPLQAFLRLFDKNGNGGLDADEVEAMVRAASLPPPIATQLRALDLDRSGRIEEAELAPWFELVRSLVPGVGKEAMAGASTLPPPWQSADADGNGRLEASELAALLRRLDPALVRWAPHLLRALDRDGDGALAPSELPAAVRPPRHGTALGPRTAPTATVSQAPPAIGQ
ncbi:MAG: hypothetical protein KF830_00380 [Planctomycetes bacterium]|nr:hypothetical protein [Planctomycetota bacterium]